MSSSGIEVLAVRGIGALALSVALACGLTPASASGKHSSPRDLQRFVSIARSLELDPLNAGSRENREWALDWLTKAPDVTVNICLEALGGLEEAYPYVGELTLQDSFSMGAFIIEHPDMANDLEAQHVAGVEGMLKAYRSILRDKPDAKSPALETLLQTQSKGGLSDFIRGTSCVK